ncbi:MAG: hypothetical protein KGM42_02700 [Hyphomicrobiales bacterium]|nr:hypothetical protein [Hyphomicrobiales bacterium]
MPTTLVTRTSLASAQGRRTDRNDGERSSSTLSSILLFAAISLAAFAACVVSLEYGLHPTPAALTEISALLAP